MRYLPLFLASLWRMLAPPAQGRHARQPQPAPGRRHFRPVPHCRTARRVPDTRPPRWTVPLSAPTWRPPVLDETPVRPYYRAWEEERRRRAQDRDRLGIAVLRDISTQLPHPDLRELATAVRQWQHLGVGV
ncbi:hypothetical protein [Nocardiopsis lambiniae]|uniref:Secreted protein n=1 Tax=Nocardiopsis lambiniae TaxID=3075539 RepID=A0ABU2M358_9ACTN|nr:hypothetical protein [Nocardiopsis sp. DSM 44743]MDT0327062.1 hypothetical protein [Nocardiopsis sp. DSM 44743]